MNIAFRHSQQYYPTCRLATIGDLGWQNVINQNVSTHLHVLGQLPVPLRQVKDLHYGEVLFHFYQEDYFTALTHLMAAQDQGKLDDNRRDGELLIGGLKLSYGLHREAEAIFRRLLTEQVPARVRDRAWYYLARLAYQKGRVGEAEQALMRIGEALPPSVQGQRQLLHALVQMSQQNYPAAVTTLRGWSGSSDDRPYARYNLGVALIRSGAIDEGVAILDALGAPPVEPAPLSASFGGDELQTWYRLLDAPLAVPNAGEEGRSLRDKANLALGYALLEREPERAKGYLQRIRLQGPLSSQALLGVGWADAAGADYAGALLPWSELRQRSPSDPAVQEALLALPYAFAQVEAYTQAADAYERTIAALDAELVRLEDAMTAVRRGELLRVTLQRQSGIQRSLTEVPAHSYLAELLSGHLFTRAVRDYRDLQSLQNNLRYWSVNLAGYDFMLAASRERYQQQVPRVQEFLQALDLRALQQRRDAAREALEPDTPEPPLLGEIDTGLDQLAQARERLIRAQHESSARLRVKSGQIYGMRRRVAQLQPRVDRALTDQALMIERLTLRELESRRNHLSDQLTKARFGLAKLYDKAVSSPPEAQ